jgi:subtilase family serine protease
MESLFISHPVRWLSLSLALGALLLSSPAHSQTVLRSLPTRHVPQVVLKGTATPVGILKTTKIMHLSLLLPLRNQQELNQLLKKLYDPSSPDYRHFLTTAQVNQEFGPSTQDYQAVVAWARSKGFTIGKELPNHLVVPITGTVGQVNAAFHIELQSFRKGPKGRLFYSPKHEPSTDLTVPLWHISGLTNYSVPRPMLAAATSGQADAYGSGPNGSYLPSDMRAAYYGGTSLTGSGQCVGLAEFGGYYPSDVAGDLDGSGYAGSASITNNGNNGYTLTYSPPNGGGPYTIAINNVLVDGGTMTPPPNDPTASREAALDIAQAIGMAPGLSQVRVYVAPDEWTTSSPNYSYPSNSAASEIFSNMENDSGTCKQVSISWGWRPTDIKANDPALSELSAEGVSVFAAAGDSGAWSSSVDAYPAEDQYVTGVGGTDLVTSSAGGSWTSETAWSSTSGGVSPDGVTLPSYQSGLTCSGCSSAYRNGPDVAMEANADNYSCYDLSCSDDGPGTSFASPRWAGFTALANQEAANNGSSAGLGSINPLIYSLTSGSYDSVFHDIQSGSNGTYSAGYGFDLLTGWGSSNGQTAVNTLALGRAAGGYVSISESNSYPDCMSYTDTTVIVGGYEVSEPYTSGMTADQMASELASGLSSSTSPVTAMSNGSTVYIADKDPGTSGNGMSLSASGTECLIKTTYYPVLSATTSGSLSGGGGR